MKRAPKPVLKLAPNVWPRSTVRGNDGVVSIGGVAVTDIAAEFGTPVFVIDEDGVIEQAQYAVKAKGHVAKLARELAIPLPH